MIRLVLDRLWPMLAGLAALLAGALVLEGYARQRANDPIHVVIHDERAGGGEDEGDAGGVDVVNDEPARSARHTQARALARRAEWTLALPLYAEELKEHPGDPALLAEYGGCVAASGAADRGIELIAKADALRPTFATALRLGQLRARVGDPAAEADLRRALALRPGSATAALALGQLLLRRGDAREASSLLEAASASGSNEDRARALVALGGAFLASDRRAEAERAFERAIEYAPARAEIRIGIARAWLAGEGKDRAQRAVQVLVKAAELSPDLPQVHAALGRARERTGEKQLAQESYDLALRLDPTSRLARRRLVRLALSRSDFARARQEADRLVADAPGVPEHHFLAARVAVADGRRDDAREAYRKAIAAAQGDYPEAYLNLGVLERNAGDFAAARAAYERALELRPRYGAAWVNLGKLAEAQERPVEAERCYLRAIELEPRLAAAWLAAGQLRTLLGRWADAEAALRNARSLQPGEAAELALAEALTGAGKLDDAVRSCEAVVQANPRNVGAWYQLALVEKRRGRPDSVRAALQRALEVDPAHPGSLLELGRLELDLRRIPEARRAFEDLLDVAPGDRGARAGLAEVDALSGRRSACEAQVAQLRAESANDPLVLAAAARCASAAVAPVPAAVAPAQRGGNP